jgi:hypothetical protein
LARIRKAEVARRGIEVAHSLHVLNKELLEQASRLTAVAERFHVFRSNKVPVTAPAELRAVDERLRTIAGQFREKPVVATLKAGTRWTNLMSSLESLSNAARRSLDEAWKQHLKTALFSGLPPDTLRARLAPTPQNNKRLSDYTRLYAAFIAYRERPPESSEQFDELQALSRKLSAITFEQDVPKDVAAFLRATSSEEGGGLALLTTEVLHWLRENNLLNKYVIRARLG